MQTTITRPDEDILEDISRLFASYPPLQRDRKEIYVEVNRGVVTLIGYTKASPTYRYLQANLPDINGIKFINADQLYDDEEIRRHLGKVIPFGVQVRVEYGAVVLTGKLPEGTNAEDVVKQVAGVDGVKRVITAFY